MRTLLILAVIGTCAASSCTQTTNTIIGTGSLTKTTTSSADDCCTACFNYGYTCKAFTFETATKTCTLKSNTDGNTVMKGSTSGITAAGPSPPPAANMTVETRACLPGKTDHFPYCNTSMSIEVITSPSPLCLPFYYAQNLHLGT